MQSLDRDERVPTGGEAVERIEMPKKYGLKEKDQVVEFITDQLLIGGLRTGDRIDRAAIAQRLGLSRAPVAEAIMQLEHDGILSTRYHRGAFVERFDAATVLEHHQVYGALSGIASARAARYPTPRVLDELGQRLLMLRNAVDSRSFHEAVMEYRRSINHHYAGPRLRAAIRSSQSFIPQALWVSYADSKAVLLPFYEREHAAIRQRKPEVAEQVCRQRATEMARVVVAELVRRGVLEATDDVELSEAGDPRPGSDRKGYEN